MTEPRKYTASELVDYLNGLVRAAARQGGLVRIDRDDRQRLKGSAAWIKRMQTAARDPSNEDAR